MFDDNDIIGDKAMAPRDKLKSTSRFARTRLACDQDACSRHI
jgi:hypothetical protein